MYPGNNPKDKFEYDNPAGFDSSEQKKKLLTISKEKQRPEKIKPSSAKSNNGITPNQNLKPEQFQLKVNPLANYRRNKHTDSTRPTDSSAPEQHNSTSSNEHRPFGMENIYPSSSTSETRDSLDSRASDSSRETLYSRPSDAPASSAPPSSGTSNNPSRESDVVDMDKIYGPERVSTSESGTAPQEKTSLLAGLRTFFSLKPSSPVQDGVPPPEEAITPAANSSDNAPETVSATQASSSSFIQRLGAIFQIPSFSSKPQTASVDMEEIISKHLKPLLERPISGQLNGAGTATRQQLQNFIEYLQQQIQAQNSGIRMENSSYILSNHFVFTIPENRPAVEILYKPPADLQAVTAAPDPHIQKCLDTFHQPKLSVSCAINTEADLKALEHYIATVKSNAPAGKSIEWDFAGVTIAPILEERTKTLLATAQAPEINASTVIRATVSNVVVTAPEKVTSELSSHSNSNPRNTSTAAQIGT
jgi:hypothetical protein